LKPHRRSSKYSNEPPKHFKASLINLKEKTLQFALLLFKLINIKN